MSEQSLVIVPQVVITDAMLVDTDVPEADYPARIFNSRDTEQILGGGSSGQQIDQLRQEQQAQAFAITAVQLRMTRLLERGDGFGMPPERQSLVTTT